MSKVSEAKEILKNLGFDVDKIVDFQSEKRKNRILKIFCSVASIKEKDKWSNSKSYIFNKFSIRSREIIAFLNKNYNESIADGSYDDIRRKNLKYLEEAKIIDNSANIENSATNNPMRGYSLTEEVVKIVRLYPSKEWKKKSNEFVKKNGQFSSILSKTLISSKPVKIKIPNGNKLSLTSGEHNEIQKKIIEEFLPKFLKKPYLLYLGDTAKKTLVIDEKFLQSLGFKELKHDMLPDILAFDEDKKILYLVEAVHSSNPINQLRYMQLKKFTMKCKYRIIMVSAFKNRESFRKYCINLSWDTSVWLTNEPDHLIKFD